MRAKALITLTLLALIVTACATVRVNPEEEAYKRRILDISVRHTNIMEAYANDLDTNNYSLIYRSALSTMDQQQRIRNVLQATTPPLGYSEFHSKFIKVFEKNIIALTYMKKGYAILLGLEKGTEKDAVKYINMSRDTTREANRLMREAKAIWPK